MDGGKIMDLSRDSIRKMIVETLLQESGMKIHEGPKIPKIKKGMYVWFADGKHSAKKLRVKHLMKSKDGKEYHYITAKGTFTADDVVGY